MMQVYYAIDALPDFTRAVITIGTFDGIHQGHRQIIDALIAEAKSVNGESVMITFHPHPRKIIQPGKPLQLIHTLEEKVELFASTGIDHLVVVPFTPAFAALDADAYISDFLVTRFHPHTIIIGYDHHFGKGRQGNFELLAKHADRYGYRLLEIPKYLLDAIAVSSTEIRQAIHHSDIATANRLLGYPFFFEGRVMKGDQLGRTLGYPTANLEYEDVDKIRAGHGVYAVYVRAGKAMHRGVLSIGTRPTLGASEEKVEAHIFDWEGDLYGQTLRVIMVQWLRAQERYDSLEALKAQMKLDEENSRAVL